MTTKISRAEAVGWAVASVVLAALAIPWFLWGADQVAYGLPIWVWWHAAWMLVASATFYAFTRRAWGLGVEGVQGG